MNVTLTFDFESMDELTAFLKNREAGAAVATADQVAATPAKLESVPTPAAVQEVAPAPAPIDPLSDAPAEVDFDALRAEIMTKLKTLAGSMEDPALLGKFINNFGVSRFSELGDDQLQGFAATLKSEFGV